VSETQNKAVTAKENEIRELGRTRYRCECPDDEFYTSEKAKLEQELKDLKKARAKAENRAKDWRTIADETFSFARYAEEDFNSDSIENKRTVLAKLGQKLTLLDGKLQFTPNKYMVPVQTSYPALLARYEAARTLPQQMRKAAEAAIKSEWCGSGDSNPLARGALKMAHYLILTRPGVRISGAMTKKKTPHSGALFLVQRS
jgi:hypothetical protein